MFEEKHLKVGSKIPSFNLLATDTKHYSPNTFKDKAILIVIFTCNHCPYVQAYEDRIIKLQNDFKDRGVQFIAINSNDENNYPEDNYKKMVERAELKKFNFPYLRDETQEVAKLFGATYTPEVFLFDKNREMQYHGRIDDNWQEPNKVVNHNLREAIESVLNRKEVNRTNTQAIGCTVKWKQ